MFFYSVDVHQWTIKNIADGILVCCHLFADTNIASCPTVNDLYNCF